MKFKLLDVSSTPISSQTSLIIPSRNRPALLEATITSVLEGSQVPAEIVVVDQSTVPNDAIRTFTTDRPCTILYLWARSTGLSRARNEGIAAANHDILIFTDDDMLVDHQWFEVLTESLVQAQPRAVVTGKVLAVEEGAGNGFAPSVVTGTTPTSYMGRIGTDALAGGNLAACRSSFQEIGLFDERLGAGSTFPSAEDNDLGYRLLEAGYRIDYVPQAVLYHRAWRSSDDYLSLRWSYGKGKGGYYAKHLDLLDHYMLHRMIRDVGRRILQFPYRIRYERARAWGDLVYSLGVLYGCIRWLAVETMPTIPHMK